jgi:hypothetical protein
MRGHVVIGTVVGLLASAALGWAAHGAGMALGAFHGTCVTSRGIDDCAPGLSRYLLVGAAGLAGVAVAAVLGARRLTQIAALLAAGAGAVLAEFRLHDHTLFVGWFFLLIGAGLVTGEVVNAREARRGGRDGRGQ